MWKAERTRFYAFGPCGIKERRTSVQLGAVNDRLAVRGKPRPVDITVAKREPAERKGRRLPPLRPRKIAPYCDRRKDDDSYKDRDEFFRARCGWRHWHRDRSADSGKNFQVKRQIARGLESLFAILLQAMADDEVDHRRNTDCAHAQLRRIFFEDGVHRLHGRVGLERAPAGEHLVEDRAEGKDIGAMIDLLAADLFG